MQQEHIVRPLVPAPRTTDWLIAGISIGRVRMWQKLLTADDDMVGLVNCAAPYALWGLRRLIHIAVQTFYCYRTRPKLSLTRMHHP